MSEDSPVAFEGQQVWFLTGSQNLYGEEIGHGIVETLADSRSTAVLMRNHGVFTVGPGPLEAIKAAVMCEDVARTVHLARALGEVKSIGDREVEALHDRYQHVYGQR